MSQSPGTVQDRQRTLEAAQSMRLRSADREVQPDRLASLEARYGDAAKQDHVKLELDGNATKPTEESLGVLKTLSYEVPSPTALTETTSEESLVVPKRMPHDPQQHMANTVLLRKSTARLNKMHASFDGHVMQKQPSGQVASAPPTHAVARSTDSCAGFYRLVRKGVVHFMSAKSTDIIVALYSLGYLCYVLVDMLYMHTVTCAVSESGHALAIVPESSPNAELIDFGKRP